MQSMPSYIVRVRDSHEAIGIYSADDEDELRYFVDEITDIADCEFAQIRNGGVTWPAGGARKLPLTEVDWDRPQEPPLTIVGRPELNETWFLDLTDEKLVFQPLVSDRDIIANDP